MKIILFNKKAISLNIIFISIFLIFYSFATQIIYINPVNSEFSIYILDDWHNKLFLVRAFPNFEPIGYITFGQFFITLPIPTLMLGIFISTLVSINMSVSVYSWTNSKCRINPATGFASSLPAFLTGFACCSPIFIISLGSSALSTVFIEIFPLLIPVTLLMLILSLFWSLMKLDKNFKIVENPIILNN